MLIRTIKLDKSLHKQNAIFTRTLNAEIIWQSAA